MGKKVRLWTLLVAGLLGVCAVLAACGVAGVAEPTNAAEVYERYRANEAADNYHLVMTSDLSMTVLGEQMETRMTEEGDIAGNAGHATASSEIYDQSAEVELYVTEEDGAIVAYTKTSDSDVWTRQECGSVPGDVSGVLGNAGKLQNAVFEKVEDGYVVTTKGAGFENISAQLGSLEMMGEDARDAVENAFADTIVTIEFDKDCLPRSLDTQVDIPLEGTNVAAVLSDMAIDMHVEMSRYGSVDPASVAVPDSVKKSAEVDMNSADDAHSDNSEIHEDADEDSDATGR
ncbi:MAG: hypothetical protein IKF14_09850 [Atopobiaceae bacterium]|nr:hypothetical protein [Atopobiaceae bacterium]